MAKLIGKYEIVSEIGRGGFGRVYRAVDPSVGREVAIKVLLVENDPSVLARFRREAMAAGKLRHRNVVTLYDFGEHEGNPFIVMELLDGEDLRQVIGGNRRLTILQCAGILSQIAEGLNHAHHRGVLHRDVKPANVMLLPDESVKLMDFGIARVGRESSAGLTPTGGVVGTFRYLAPEQFRGGEQDARSDIFSYGILCFELLARKHPFDAPDQVAVMYNITAKEPEPLWNFCPECPSPLEQLVRTALQKDPDMRYGSLDDLLLDLRPIESDLKRERASELATEAGQLIERKEIDTALVALRDALALDPGCQEARRLHDATQRETRRRSVRPQIETLVRKSEDAIAARQFTDALQNLDLAQRLDPSDPDLQMRLERARSLHECSLAARASLTAAREELANQRLQEAHERVREALIADPGNPSAERLLEVVRDAIALAESESKYGEHLDIARHFFASNDFNRAIGVLSALCAARPDVDEARQLLAQAQQRQLASELETAAVARARKILSKGEFAEATELLEKLRADSPSNPEVLDLLEEATAGKLRSERIAQVVTRAALLREALDYPAALDALRGALTSYPESYELRAALRTAQDAQRRHESEQAARQAMFASMAEREPEETPTKILQPADLRPPPSIEPERTPAIVPRRRRRVLFAGIGAVSVLLFVIVFFRPNVRPNPVEQTHTAQPDVQAEPPRLAPVHSTREPAVTNPKVDHKVEVPIVSVGKENTALSAPSPTDLIVKSLNSANTVPPRAAPTEEKPPIKPPATAAALPASTQTASLPTVQPAVTPPSSTPAPTPIVSAPRPVSTIPAAAEARDRGMHLVSLKSYDEAIGNFTEAIRLRPDYAAAYRDRGATYQNMYRFREAIEDYRKTLSIDPNYRDAGGLLKDAEYKLSIGLQQPDKYFRQPQTIDAPDARYTAEAIRAGATHGVVRLIFVVDAHGHADDFRVLESPGFHLDEEAIRAVGKCKFRPAEKNGSPVPYEVSLSVKFRRP